MEKIILDIVNERQLISIMNNTKWSRLVEGIQSLPFQPAFQLKLLTEKKLLPPTFSQHITYIGDWQHLHLKIYSYSNIEWMKIRPVLYKHVGRLVPDEKIECLSQLQQLLEEYAFHMKWIKGMSLLTAISKAHNRRSEHSGTI